MAVIDFRSVISSLRNLLGIYCLGLILFILYLYILSVLVRFLSYVIIDPLLFNVVSLLMYGFLTLVWLYVWWVSMLKIRNMLIERVK